MRIAAAVMLVACGLVAAAWAQSPTAAPTALNQANEALARGDYLEAVDRYRAAAFRPDGSRDEAAFGAWLQVHPFIGGVLDPAAIGSGPAAPIDPEVAERLRRAEVRDAIAEIRRRAARTSIVILNESHNMPRDRAFALEVARALRPLGYATLAVETFSNYPGRDGANVMEQLVRDRYVRRGTGYFTDDPVFADFVRQAIAIGYRPVAYEPVLDRVQRPLAEQIAHREQGQAEMLVARIFRDNPGAKVLIYVGYAHVYEAPLPSSEWMASRLKRLTGIDPLTIDQTLIDETMPSQTAYRDLIARRIGRRPAILFNDGRPLLLGSTAAMVDLQVWHPQLRLVRGRPDWLWRMGRRAVPVPSPLLPRSGRRLIQAFAADEAADSIPLDQIVIEAGQPAPPLLVPRGTRLRWAWQDPRSSAAIPRQSDER